MAAEAEDSLIEEIARLIFEMRDPAWSQVAIEIAFADGFSQMRTWSRTGREDPWRPTARYAPMSEDLAGRFAELRRIMYRPDVGTWLSAQLTVSDGGDYSSDFDLNGKPHFDPPVAPELFLEDLRAFPRDPSRVPAWMTEDA
jgi:hypothetical protein